MSRRTYYDILGVSRRADADEVKRAFRELARRHHPDQNPDEPDAEEEFKAVAEAYRVLSDPDLRRAYDRYGIAPAGAAFVDPLAPVGATVANSVRDFARAAARRLRARRGDHIRLTVKLEFAAAIRGSTRVLELPRRGSDGAIRPRRLAFDLPPGLEHGKVLRWPGEGAPGSDGGRPGDLLVDVHVVPHPYLRRQGNHIVAKLPLTLLELHDGADIEVPTLWGRRVLEVPAGTAIGTTLRLRGSGVPGDPAGDALFEVALRRPTLEDATVREALEAAYREGGARTPEFEACLIESRRWDG